VQSFDFEAKDCTDQWWLEARSIWKRNSFLGVRIVGLVKKYRSSKIHFRLRQVHLLMLNSSRRWPILAQDIHHNSRRKETTTPYQKHKIGRGNSTGSQRTVFNVLVRFHTICGGGRNKPVHAIISHMRESRLLTRLRTLISVPYFSWRGTGSYRAANKITNWSTCHEEFLQVKTRRGYSISEDEEIWATSLLIYNTSSNIDERTGFISVSTNTINAIIAP
jgi:hypothetical protein